MFWIAGLFILFIAIWVSVLITRWVARSFKDGKYEQVATILVFLAVLFVLVIVIGTLVANNVHISR